MNFLLKSIGFCLYLLVCLNANPSICNSLLILKPKEIKQQPVDLDSVDGKQLLLDLRDHVLIDLQAERANLVNLLESLSSDDFGKSHVLESYFHAPKKLLSTKKYRNNPINKEFILSAEGHQSLLEAKQALKRYVFLVAKAQYLENYFPIRGTSLGKVVFSPSGGKEFLTFSAIRFYRWFFFQRFKKTKEFQYLVELVEATEAPFAVELNLILKPKRTFFPSKASREFAEYLQGNY